MNTGELTLLLTRMSIVDGRDVDDLTLEAWEPLIGDLRYEDAVQGLNTFYRNSPRRPTPADVREAATVFSKRWSFNEELKQEETRKAAGLCHAHRHAMTEEPMHCTNHHVDDSGSGRCHYCGERP